MTILTQTNKNEYIGNSSITMFDYTFPLLDAAHMVVYLDGSPLVGGYSVSGVGSPTGGTVTLNAAPASGVVVTLLREVPLTQQTDYTEYDAFPAETHERALDKLTQITQQLSEAGERQLGRAPGRPNWDAQGRRITNVADPVDPNDATNKSFADGIVEQSLAQANRAEQAADRAEDVAASVQVIAGVYVGEIAPDVPLLTSGNRWYKPSEATTYIYYCDVDGCQWVQEPVANVNIESPFLTPAMFGAIGDGSNEQDKIQAMFNNAVGKVVVLEPSKTYGITNIAIPDDVVLISNFSKFIKLTPSSSYGIVVGNRFRADTLSLDVQGAIDDNGIRIAGSLADIGYVRVLSIAFDSQIGVYISSPSGTISGLNIRKITATRFRTSIYGVNITESEFSKLTANDYRTGVYFRDISNSKITGVLARFKSPSAMGGAGENGLLIESVSSSFATNNCTFEDIDIRDSAEHGVRIGGLVPSRNLQFTKVRTRNTGAGGATATGGQGFKILMFDQDGRYHQNITIDDIVVEDCSVTGNGIGNFAAVSFGLVDGLTLRGLIVRNRNQQFSAWHGLSLYECKNLNIENITILNTRQYCIRLEGGVGAFVQNLNENILIKNALLSQEPTISNFCIKAEPRDSIYRNIDIQANVRYGLAAFHTDAPGVGTYEDCCLDIKYRDQVGDLSTPAVRGADVWLLNYKGGFYGTFGMDVANGSIVQDDAGNVRIKKSGTWVTL